MKITAVLCVRNEAAFLLDWLAWHQSVGVTDFVVVSNDCIDGTDTLLDTLKQHAWLTHIRNAAPYGKGGIQFSGLKKANAAEAVKAADWLMVLDIDEFVNPHVGNRTLPDLIDALPQATAITLTWRNFGNAGVVAYADTPVPVQFTQASQHPMPWPWRASMFKTLYKNDKTYRNLGIHRPRNPVEGRLPSAHWFDGAGRVLGPDMATGRVFSDYRNDQHALVQLNHYPLGAIESYVLKADRGRAVHSDDVLGMDYWVERNVNSDEDTSALALWDRAALLRAKLADTPRVAELHTQAVAWRKTRFKELMAEDRYRDLFGRLVMTGPSTALDQNTANMLTQAALNAQKSGAKSS